MRHFAHHIGDYAAATAHLSFVEDAAYHRLLRLYYRDERALPSDVAACQRLVAARSREERAAVEAMLLEFFTLEADGWHQSRADDELAAYSVRANTARENGMRSGGRPKTKRKPKDKPTNNQVGYATDTQEKPSRTLTNNQEPITNSVPHGTGATAPLSTRDAIWKEGLPWLVERSGLTRQAAASIVGKWCSEFGDDAVLAALTQAEHANPVAPVPWITSQFKPRETYDQRRIREGLAVINAYEADHDRH